MCPGKSGHLYSLLQRICSIYETMQYTLWRSTSLHLYLSNFLANFYLYCTDNENSAVDISNDGFHTHNNEAVKKLKLLSFVREKYPTDSYIPDRTDKYTHVDKWKPSPDNSKACYERILTEGRGENWGGKVYAEDPYIELEEYEDEIHVRGEVYLNALGFLISGCNWSYDNQHEHIICNVYNDVESYIEYFKMYEKKGN